MGNPAYVKLGEVVRDGQPIEPALRLERVTLDELLESARNQGIANLRDIDLAILEPSGNFLPAARAGRRGPAGLPRKAQGLSGRPGQTSQGSLRSTYSSTGMTAM